MFKCEWKLRTHFCTDAMKRLEKCFRPYWSILSLFFFSVHNWRSYSNSAEIFQFLHSKGKKIHLKIFSFSVFTTHFFFAWYTGNGESLTHYCYFIVSQAQKTHLIDVNWSVFQKGRLVLVGIDNCFERCVATGNRWRDWLRTNSTCLLGDCIEWRAEEWVRQRIPPQWRCQVGCRMASTNTSRDDRSCTRAS